MSWSKTRNIPMQIQSLAWRGERLTEHREIGHQKVLGL